jgi:hypothetical protein
MGNSPMSLERKKQIHFHWCLCFDQEDTVIKNGRGPAYASHILEYFGATAVVWRGSGGVAEHGSLSG